MRRHSFALLLALAPSLVHAQAPDRAARAAWLQANAVPVRSVDPADTDFSDLAAFGKMIGDARIVMLGEQSHGDGTVFHAKTRLIKYLHEQLGFDVLAVESGLYDVQKAWELLQMGEEPVSAIRRGMFGIWTRSEQVLPLMDYVGQRAKTARPLVMAGFDSQLTASSSRDFWVSDLLTFLYTHNVALPASWTAARPVLDSLIMGRYYQSKATEEQQKVFFAVIDSITARVATLPVSDTATLFWQQNLRSIRAHATFNFVFEPNPPAFKASDNNGRDVQMAENLIWLAERRYPGKKIIVWAATFHNIRNPTTVGEPGFYEGLRTMGHVAWEKLGEQIYNLGFVASEGKLGPWSAQTKRDVPVPSPESLDGLLASTTHDLAILDFRNLPPGGEWLRSPLVSGPLGYSPMSADWTRVLDGVMYTRVMTPSTPATR